jgi:hypothetical protein
VPYIRTYRADPLTVTLWVPPVPAVVEYAVVQVLPSVESRLWYAVAKALSRCSPTWQTGSAEPRSTCSHWGSLNALDQRVPVPGSRRAGSPPSGPGWSGTPGTRTLVGR